MKQRISALDLQILARELRNNLEGYRLTNIYNIADSSRQFLLRFNKPESKVSLVVDCGLRIHLTDYDRPIPSTPSGFVVKLRKHLRGKRLSALRQVENDRILVLQFADGMFYLVLEFFSAGNVILLDENKKILSLQRIVHEHENKVGEVYNMFDDRILAADFVGNAGLMVEPRQYSRDDVKSWLDEAITKFSLQSKLAAVEQAMGSKTEGKKKNPKPTTIHKLLLSKEPHLSSDLLSKNLKGRKIDPSTPCIEFSDKEQALVDLLLDTEAEYLHLLQSKDVGGFIVAKKNAHYQAENDSSDLEFIYENFHPFQPLVEEKDADKIKVIHVPGDYNKTLDTFFSTIESSKYALRIQQQEQLAKKKLEDARQENDRKIQALLDVQSSNEQKGHTIIANADLVEEAKFAVQGLVDQQMDWKTIEKLIKHEQRKGNKIALVIDLPLKLEENKINLLLPHNPDHTDQSESRSQLSSSDDEATETSDDEEAEDSDASEVSDFETENTLERANVKKPVNKDKIKIEIDLDLSAYANASKYFTVKKSSVEKQKKVEKNVEKAMKNIEQRIDKQLKQKLKESHNVLRKVRVPYFFEKHFWFYSSEGFLVLMARSPMETDLIYSKYIEDDDIYMCSSFDTQVWIKNPDRTEVPPNTLMQAGVFCLAASEAWSKKISSSPQWCFAKNVTKFDQTDEGILEPGMFRLKKESEMNHLPPAQLVMGFGFLWKVQGDDEDMAEDDKNKDSEDEDNQDESGDEGEEKDEHETENTIIEGASETKPEAEFQEVRELSVELKHLQVEATSEPSEAHKNTGTGTASVTDVTEVLPQMNKNVRGKKGKLKKIQKKYADQDEDERLRRLEALGTLKGLEKNQLKAQEELARQQNREYKKARRERQKELQTLRFTKNEKVQINYGKIASEIKARTDKDDQIVDAIPVFAPWSALQKCKYKAKIQPGSGKKTKTVTEVLNYFCNRDVDPSMTDREADWPKEHEIIRQMKPQDLVLIICSDKLKVSLPGGSNTQKGKAKSKKKK
ncbi:hypothetical protein HG536_0B05910 [Torulaspora globosa]|uniref:Ribosome quality control complex subunit 2 n=1 Tax=Torulaspora globosa TaxID=48254 RepID=A0A7G3ZDY9_9SACH|nr:uncharacterized protein HG536_0B05910 [Torulaspora globosa]QLL31725.1 hypothetical protein HG536_0B05910 [Torulaspora globosa]